MYIRVIPRDLFNEASLLKCFGRIYLNLEILNLPDVSLEHDGEPFDVDQDENSGALLLVNVHLMVRGQEAQLHRPLNSRGAWPLYLTLNDDEIEIFTDTGDFTSEMLGFLNA